MPANYVTQTSNKRFFLERVQAEHVRLPDEAQKTIFSPENNPIALADFFCNPKTIVFVDGSVHHLDYVQDADNRKRNALKGLGYRIVVIKTDSINEGLSELKSKL